MGDVVPEDQAIAETIALLNYYGFELDGETAAAVIAQWQVIHPTAWIRPAVLESLYRGRYKRISVEEILRVWEKWGKPKLNFSREFEHLICAKLSDPAPVPPTDLPTPEPLEKNPPASPFPHLPLDLYRGSGIKRFHPQPDLEGSDAYKKLKAIATQPEPTAIENNSPQEDNKKP